MSQRSQLLSPDQTIDVRIDGGPTEDGHYPPQPAQDQTSERLSHSSDPSIPLLSLYLRIAEEHHERRCEILSADADQILVFCGLFAATLGGLIMPWLSSLPNSPTTSESSPTPGNGTPSFQASQNFVRANLFWLYSLLLSISCALTALSLRQWVRRSPVTLSHYSLSEHVRLGALSAARIERSNRLIKNLHSTVHISLAFFFVGLLLFFWSLNRPAFYPALIWTVCFVWFYASDKFAVFRQSFLPSYTLFTQTKANDVNDDDDDILKRTLDMIRSDDDLEEFFEAIPGYCASKTVDDPRRSLDILGQRRLAEALVAFWNRTLSSRWASESVKGRRLVICIELIEAADLSIAVPEILQLFSLDRGGASRSVEIGHTLGILRNGKTASLSRGIVTSIISNAERSDRWFFLAMDELGISSDVLRGYLAHGNSVLLANLIHITRQIFHSSLELDPDLTVTRITSSLLPSVSKFDILNTLPELQHDFCALWNEIVQQVQSSGADTGSFIDILIEIRHLYVALHATDATVGCSSTPTTGRDDPSRQKTSYPFCMVPDHRSNLNIHPEEVSGTAIGRASHPTATTSPILAESSPRGVPMAHHTATGITSSISDTPISSMAQPVAHSPQ